MNAITGPIMCFAEVRLDQMADHTPRIRRSRIEPMAVVTIDHTAGKSEDWKPFIEFSWERVKELAEVPPDRRAVRIDWAGNNEIKYDADTQQTYLILREIGKRWMNDPDLSASKARFVYADQEHPGTNAPERLSGLMSCCADWADRWGNHNYCTGVDRIPQLGWWGLTYPRVGNASCPEGYCWNGANGGGRASIWERFVSTLNQIRSCNAYEAGSCVPALPVVCVEHKGLVTAERSLWWTRQLVMHAVLTGCRMFTWPTYMTPDNLLERMADTITEAIDEANLLLSARNARLGAISTSAKMVATRGYVTKRPFGE